MPPKPAAAVHEPTASATPALPVRSGPSSSQDHSSDDNMAATTLLQRQKAGQPNGDRSKPSFTFSSARTQGVPFCKTEPPALLGQQQNLFPSLAVAPDNEPEPGRYNPLAKEGSAHDPVVGGSEFCYRHRPDWERQHQADEEYMEELRHELENLSGAEQQSISNVWALFKTASAKHRTLMLKGILAQSCFPQLSFISANVRELLKIDFISALPAELGFHILSFLDPQSLCRAAQVSRKWKTFADDDVVWHGMCEQHIDRKCTKCGWGLPLGDRERLRAEQRKAAQRRAGVNIRQNSPAPTRFSQDIDASAYSSDDAAEPGETAPVTREKGDSKKRTVGQALPAPTSTGKRVCTPSHNYSTDESWFVPHQRPWKEVYRDRFRIGTNWKYGRCSIKVLRGHTNGVMCLQFDDNILATGSYDSTIKIWDVETGEELQTLSGHTLGVKCLQFDRSKLVSGSLDGTLKMWDLKNGKVLRTFPGHSGAVISLHFDGSILASGSQDKTIRARDFRNCQRVVLRGHTDWVNAVKVDSASQTLYSASDDCTVRMWDLVAKRCVRVFDQHSAQVQTVLPLPADFLHPVGNDIIMPDAYHNFSTSNFTRLAITNEAERQPPPHYILTGGLDSTIRLWEVGTGRCVRTFFGHVEGIWAVAADSLRVVSGANDGIVKVWDPQTGRCERTFTGHGGPVTCVGLSDRRMATGSEDHTIRLYNFAGVNSKPNESIDESMNGSNGDVDVDDDEDEGDDDESDD